MDRKYRPVKEQVPDLNLVAVSIDGLVAYETDPSFLLPKIQEARLRFPGTKIYSVFHNGWATDGISATLDEIISASDGMVCESSPWRLVLLPMAQVGFKNVYDRSRALGKDFGWIANVGTLEGDRSDSSRFLERMKQAIPWMHQNFIDPDFIIIANWADVDNPLLDALPEADSAGAASNTITGAHYFLLKNYYIDTDGDGLNDREEFLAGTDPSDPESCFRLSGVFRQEEGSFVLSWNPVEGRTYRIFKMMDFFKTPVLIQNGIAYPQSSYTDTVNFVEQPQGFYRLETGP
jgi:hypothetical protein